MKLEQENTAVLNCMNICPLNAETIQQLELCDVSFMVTEMKNNNLCVLVSLSLRTKQISYLMAGL